MKYKLENKDKIKEKNRIVYEQKKKNISYCPICQRKVIRLNIHELSKLHQKNLLKSV
jgi:hypothetical protein